MFIKNFIFLAFFILLFGCSNSNSNDPNTVIDSSNKQQIENKEFPLSTDEALTIAESLIENTTNVSYGLWEYDGENPSEEVLLERLQRAKDYVTNDFYESNVTKVLDECLEAVCNHILPISPYFGCRHSIVPINEKHFQSSVLFAALNGTNDSSFRQTVDIIKDGDTWKISNFELKDEDINFQKEDELIEYLKKQGFINIELESRSEEEVNGKMEEIFLFYDVDVERPFKIYLRTGFIQYNGDESFSDLESYNSEFETDSENEELFDLLFEDQSIYIDQIDTSSNEVKEFLEQSQQLEQYLNKDYTEEHREFLNNLHTVYNKLLSSVYDYYSQNYPYEDGVSVLEQYFKSWNYVRNEYFDQYNVHPFELDEADINFLIDDVWIIRNQIYRLMIDESMKE